MDAAHQTLNGEDPLTAFIAGRTLAHRDKLHHHAASQLTTGGKFAEEIVKRLPGKEARCAGSRARAVGGID